MADSHESGIKSDHLSPLGDAEKYVQNRRVDRPTDCLKKEEINSVAEPKMEDRKFDKGPSLKSSGSEASQGKIHKRSKNDPYSSFQVSKRLQNHDYNEVNEMLEEYVTYLVKEFETKFNAYKLILEGETKKVGKMSNTFLSILGQGIGGITGGFLGFFLGSPGKGAVLGAKAGKDGGNKLGSFFGAKQHESKVIERVDLIHSFHKNKNIFREKFVKAGLDIVQSYEMQFMRVTTNQGRKKAMQLLARDAMNRAINYYSPKREWLITEAVLLGESKIEPILGVPIATSKIKTPGFEINYKYISSEDQWYTSSLYEQVGLVIEGTGPREMSRYYENKDGKNRTDRYGYRRLFTSESWEKLKDKYLTSDILKSGQFIDYQYILNPKDLERKSKEILEKINLEDTNLENDRITTIIEEVKDEIIIEINNIKQHLREGSADDYMILDNIENNLRNLKVNEYLEKITQYHEEAKQERREIAESIEAGREENKENFNLLSLKQDIHHDDDKNEHKKTREGIEGLMLGIDDSSKKIDEIHEVVVAQKNKQIKEPVWFQVREQVKLFTGRVVNLEELHKQLQKKGGHVVISQVASVTGLGGIGKSELARKYAYDHRKDYDNNVIWINSEKREDLTTSFHALANRLKIPITEITVRNGVTHTEVRDIRCIVEEVYDYFKDVKCLFIFDNAEEYKHINEFLPSLSPDHQKPYILITSRNRDWDVGEDGEIGVVELNQFTPDEAKNFIKKALDIKDNTCDEDVKELAEELQYFPLALEQATAYIKERAAMLKTRGETEFKLKDYLIEYKKEAKKTELLNFKSKHSDRYIKTVYTTWKVTLQNIAQKVDIGKQAIEIMNIMAYLAPNKVHIELIFSELVRDKEKLWNAIESLKQYSMINVEKGVSNVHRLVQEVIRLQLKGQNKEQEVLRKSINLIKTANLSERDISHVTSIWNYASKYDRLIKDFYYNSVYGENESTPLHLLAVDGNQKVIETILKYTNAQNIDCVDIYGRTPLYRAAENGHIKVVELLVNRGGNIRVDSASAPSWGAKKWTLLHIAAHVGNKDVIEFLMNKDFDINVKDSMGRDPLYIAIDRGHEEVAKLLDKTGESRLFIYAALGKLELVGDILKDKSEEDKRRITNPAQPKKRGPLHLAANNGHLEVVKLLVRNGADIHSYASDGLTPLHMAAAENHLDIVKFLVEEALMKSNGGFDILKTGDSSSWTVLHSAAQRGNTEILRFLIDEFSKGKNDSIRESLINVADKKGTTLLQTAAYHDQLDTVKFLIDQKADINYVDIFGAPPLFAASVCNNFEVVKYLLQQDETRIYCDLEKVLGILDITPLHCAVLYDNLDMVQLFIERSRINVGETSSLTPLHVAAMFDSSNVIEHLLENGASSDTKMNISNVIQVLDFIKGDLKGGYGSKFVSFVINSLNLFNKLPFIGYLIYSQFTPTNIATALKYSNQLVRRDDNGQVVRSWGSKVVSFFLFVLPVVEKQLKMIKDFIQSKKSGGSSPPLGEDFIIYDIANQNRSVN